MLEGGRNQFTQRSWSRILQAKEKMSAVEENPVGGSKSNYVPVPIKRWTFHCVELFWVQTCWWRTRTNSLASPHCKVTPWVSTRKKSQPPDKRIVSLSPALFITGYACWNRFFRLVCHKCFWWKNANRVRELWSKFSGRKIMIHILARIEQP